MFDANKKYRIVNKSAKGVKLTVNGQSLELDWDSFKKQFNVVDKFYATIHPEFLKKMNRVDDLVNEALVCVMFQNGNGSAVDKMTHMALLAQITKEICEILNCTSFEAAALIKQRMDMFKDDPLGVALGVAPKEKFYKKNEKKDEPKPTPIYEEKKPTLGDAFSCLAELKEKMEGK